jgi:hypothetical protein
MISVFLLAYQLHFIEFFFITDSKEIKININVNFSVSEVRRDWRGGRGVVGCGGKGWGRMTCDRGV